MISEHHKRGGLVMVRVVTDSSCDLPAELLKKHRIPFVSLNVFINNKTYREDLEINPEEFWDLMSRSGELPKTSQPTPADFAKVFSTIQEEGDTPLCITISSGLSGTYQSAVLGRQLSGNKAYVFDSLAGSISHGIQVLIAARMAENGYELEAILPVLEDYRENVKIIIPLKTLENIVKGGRLSRVQASIANILNIKIILHGVKGKVELLKKVRGTRRFREAVLEIIDDAAKTGKKIFGITHVDNLDDATFFADEIKKRVEDAEVIIGKMGPTIATYAGLGGLILAL